MAETKKTVEAPEITKTEEVKTTAAAAPVEEPKAEPVAQEAKADAPAPVEKKKPGRKPKAAAEKAPTEKKKPGRKPKAAAEKAVTEKKKPGRKPKAAAEKAVTEKKKPGRKPKAAKVETVEKATRKTAKETVHVQYADKNYTTDDLVKIAKDVWKYDLKRKVGDFKSVELYVKPEESVVYYVINGEVTGSFGI